MMIKLVRRGILHNARFAVAVLVYGYKRGCPYLVRWDARFPTLYELRRRKSTYAPIAWGAAHLAALFVKSMPHKLVGVHVPESLPAKTRRNILQAVRLSGIRFKRRTIRLTPADETEFSKSSR
jgi:hypothetical protein